MSLPEESVAANTLPEVTTIPTGKKLIFTDPDTNEGGIITLENLSKQILQNLTSQTFALDQGNLTLLQALNQLNSKTELKVITTTSGEYTLVPGQITPYEVPVPSKDGYEIVSKLYSFSNGAVIYVNPNGWASNITNINRTCTFSTIWLLRKK